MNTVAEKIAVMQAHDEGKNTQARPWMDYAKDSWVESSNPSWDWNYWEYRNKPEPIEGYVNVYAEGLGLAVCTTPEEAHRYAGLRPHRTIKMREVIED